MAKLENLVIWNSALQLVTDIYRLTSNAQFKKDFGLRDQIQRATVSIPSNIAEGLEYDSDKVFVRYLRIAKGSCAETRTQLLIAKNLSYISSVECDLYYEKLIVLSRQIGSLIKHLSKKT